MSEFIQDLNGAPPGSTQFESVKAMELFRLRHNNSDPGVVSMATDNEVDSDYSQQIDAAEVIKQRRLFASEEVQENWRMSTGDVRQDSFSV